MAELVKKRGPYLRGEDRQLWNAVTRTIVPKTASKTQNLQEEMLRLMGNASPAEPKPPAQTPPQAFHTAPVPTPMSPPPKVQHPIEERVLKKLARGRQAIDARIDLHGMTQDRARFALLDFLQQSQATGARIVLVITGKGNEGGGVLRRNVPLWLETRPFAGLVNGTRPAHISHGGDGALYVRLRKSQARTIR